MPGITPAMKHFMLAERYAVLGRVMTDPSRFDHKVYTWYTARDIPVAPVKYDGQGTEEIDGARILSDVRHIPNLSKTSISIILNPKLGLPILQSLFPPTSSCSPSPSTAPSLATPTSNPHAVWFQPGAADEAIRTYVRKHGLEGRVVMDQCVLVSGDQARRSAAMGGGEAGGSREKGGKGEKGRL